MSSIKHSITRSFIIVPLMATTLSMNAFSATTATAVTPTISSQNQQTMATDAEPASDMTLLQSTEREEAAQIDAYFSANGMPLAGYGMEMVTEAEKHGLDPYLIPAIAVRESTGGLHQCKSVSYSPFGFGSCKISFKSYNDAIATLATNLGGDNPNTAKAYEGKSLNGILYSYNQEDPGYNAGIKKTMKDIANTQVAAQTIGNNA